MRVSRCRGRTLIDNLSIVIVDIVHIQTGRLARMMDWSSALAQGTVVGSWVAGTLPVAIIRIVNCPA